MAGNSFDIQDIWNRFMGGIQSFGNDVTDAWRQATGSPRAQTHSPRCVNCGRNPNVVQRPRSKGVANETMYQQMVNERKVDAAQRNERKVERLRGWPTSGKAIFNGETGPGPGTDTDVFTKTDSSTS